MQQEELLTVQLLNMEENAIKHLKHEKVIEAGGAKGEREEDESIEIEDITEENTTE